MKLCAFSLTSILIRAVLNELGGTGGWFGDIKVIPNKLKQICWIESLDRCSVVNSVLPYQASESSAPLSRDIRAGSAVKRKQTPLISSQLL